MGSASLPPLKVIRQTFQQLLTVLCACCDLFIYNVIYQCYVIFRLRLALYVVLNVFLLLFTGARVSYRSLVLI